MQVPAWQESDCVQALPSLQLAPSAFTGVEQEPVAGSQVPVSWHWSIGVQTTGLAPVQTPAWQESDRVQALPSSQLEPSAFAGSEHMPVAGSQVPAAWRWSVATQTIGLAPMHEPGWQESDRVQALPSSQAEPSAFAGSVQMPVAGLQVPAVWHWSVAAQRTGLAPVQTPAWQESERVQASPSSQKTPSVLAGCEHVPVFESQVPASWHWSVAAQT